MIKKIQLVILGTLWNVSLFAQVDSVDLLIKKLSWESLFLKTTYVTELVLNKEAEKLISTDTKTIKKLFDQISNKQKTVVVHIILTRILEPQNSRLEGHYIYKNDSVVAVNYSYNNLDWLYSTSENKNTIEDKDVKKIKTYWEKKIRTN